MKTREKLEKARRVPKQARARAMVEDILDATAQVLSREGYRRASTNRIAEKAGVSIGSLYQYFPNKEALLTALNARLAQREMKVIQEKFREIENVPIQNAVREIVKAMVDSHRVQPALHRVLVEQVPAAEDRPRREKLDARIMAMIRAYVEGGYEVDGDIEVIVFVLFNVTDALTHQAVLYHPEMLEGDRLTDEITGLLGAYLRDRLRPKRRR